VVFTISFWPIIWDNEQMRPILQNLPGCITVFFYNKFVECFLAFKLSRVGFELAIQRQISRNTTIHKFTLKYLSRLQGMYLKDPLWGLWFVRIYWICPDKEWKSCPKEIELLVQRKHASRNQTFFNHGIKLNGNSLTPIRRRRASCKQFYRFESACKLQYNH
jgi:hypothetical protein